MRQHLWSGLAAVSVVLVLLLVPVHAQAEDINSMVANAKTAADHEAIAMHYDQLAADLNAKADEHNKLITTYSNMPRFSGSSKHCDKMVSDIKNGAKQASDLAAAHRKMATESK